MAMDYEKIYRIAFELPSPPKEPKYDWAAYIIFPYVRFLNKEGYGFSVFCKDNDDKTTDFIYLNACLLYTSPSPRDTERSRMPSSA